MVEEMLAARGISVTHETIRQWGLKFGREFANRIRRRAPRRGGKWHLDEVVISFAGKKHWLWRAVDQDGFVLDVLVQSRRDKKAAKRLNGNGVRVDFPASSGGQKNAPGHSTLSNFCSERRLAGWGWPG
jgi:transposase-like protein